jgi:Carboxypeptidase regulatory-like domain
MRRIIALLVLAWTACAISVQATAGSGLNQTNSHAHDFVIFATVFTEQGFALPGARVRVRRTDEQKFRWEAMSDRRGELGIRVQQDAEYELRIEARGFKPQTRKIDAREGDREDLTLQMEQLAGGKP